MGFKKAEPASRRFKLYLYGKAGTRKTVTALQFPNPAVIDAERGTVHYAEAFDFDVEHTKNPEIVEARIDDLLEDPKDYKTFVIDPFSWVYEEMGLVRLRKMRQKTGKSDYILQPMDYKILKANVGMLLSKLLALDLNIVVTARSKEMYSSEDGEFMKVIGTVDDGPKYLVHAFDTVIELVKASDGTIQGNVEKDRTNTLPPVIEEFSFKKIAKLYGEEDIMRSANADKSLKVYNDTVNRYLDVTFQGKTIKTAGVTGEILEKLAEYPEKELLQRVKNDYLKTSALDLAEDEAQSLLMDLETSSR